MSPPLSCDCGYDDDGLFDWFYTAPNNFEPLRTIRRRRCKSCNKFIDLGELCLAFHRNREPNCDIEEAIYGEGPDVPLATWYLCETCGEIYLNLADLGFCMEVDDDMRVCMSDYLRDYNPTWKPTK